MPAVLSMRRVGVGGKAIRHGSLMANQPSLRQSWRFRWERLGSNGSRSTTASQGSHEYEAAGRRLLQRRLTRGRDGYDVGYRFWRAVTQTGVVASVPPQQAFERFAC